MNTNIKRIFVLVIICIFELPLYSQPHELDLPKNSFITGISFLTFNQGIITTQDSTVYRITINENNQPQVAEIAIKNLNNKTFDVYFHQPFWLNNRCFGMVKTFYNQDTGYGGHNVLVSNDTGDSLKSVYFSQDIDFRIQKIIIHNDSTLYLGVTSDIMNSIEIIKCVIGQENVILKSTYLIGNVYPEFTVIGQDIILISSLNDSIHVYNFKNDSLTTMKTNLTITEFYDHFHELSKGINGELLGIRADGIYRSMNSGTNWTAVLQGKNFARLCQQNLNDWWVMQNNVAENWLWISPNNGLSWSVAFSVDSRFSVLAVVEPNWYWICSSWVSGKLLFGQYEKLSVKYKEHSLERKLTLGQNYPNPFNSCTSIKYQLPEATAIKLEIYNLLGQRIRTVVDQFQQPGSYSTNWNGTDDFNQHVASGVYLYELKSKNFVKTNKLIVLR